MNRTKWTRPEKRLVWLSASLCTGLLVSSGIYTWNNRVPEVNLLSRVVPVPNAEAWFLSAGKLYVSSPRANKGALIRVDVLVDEFSQPKQVPLPYTPQYDQIYPLALKKPFLQANAVTLKHLRQGLRLPYAYSLPGVAGDDSYWGRLRLVTRLLIIEAHARAQKNDWDGAADSLLDAIQLGYILPTEAPMTAIDSGGFQIRAMARRDFWLLLPHLSAQKSREAARKIETYRAQSPSLAQSLSWNLRSRQEVLLSLIKQGDLRLIGTGFPYACADMTIAGCAGAKADIERSKEELPLSLKLKLAWMNKARMMEEMTRHLNAEIALAKKPYPQRMREWPRPRAGDEIDIFIHPSNWGDSLLYAGNATQDALIATTLAIRAFRLEKGRNPRALTELVPAYLARVPLDPFSDRQPLRYQNKPKRLITSETYEPIYASAPSRNTPSPGEVSAHRMVRQYETIPFTLYSIGLNARDDGGVPYEDKDKSASRGRYKTDYFRPMDTAADVVAGINN